MRSAFLGVALLLSWTAQAEPQKISIPSLDGRLQVPGYWFEAQADGRRPAVIELHGCGGAFDSRGRLIASVLRDARYFNLERIHVLALDSFTPRGLGSICEIPVSRRSIGDDDRRADVYAAMQWLARQPSVDAARIAVVGRSNGGSAVLSIMDLSDEAVRGQPLRPRAAVAFYPACGRFARMLRYELAAPLLLMIGELDDWTSARRCVELHEKVRRAHQQPGFELIVYPDSHHGFDGAGPLQIRKNLPTKSGSATVGGNLQTRKIAYRRMFDFLSEQLDTPLRLAHDERFRGMK